ncbi:MAG: futalosine hydrolase [Phycisphaerales bacterium]
MDAGLLAPFLDAHPGRVLVATAAPAEGRAVLRALGADPGLAERPWSLHRASRCLDVVATGIGKSNAAGAVARVLDPACHRAVISTGVGGALPGSRLALGAVVLAPRSVFADEGLASPEGFVDCAALGFPLGPPGLIEGSCVRADASLIDALRPLADTEADIATVSTCSGTDALARLVRDRTGAAAEAMEGAAVGLVSARLGVPFVELRVISNTTGDRAGQAWDLRGALGVLARLIGRL